ncbi:hypothetical protein LRP52_28855 [Photobacterium sp. ZSDE20]|uniref:Gfo/Idh/MocA-like oxidoreductase C-terminal domain-containing protein n=1 Tax=Photobacterium pectinilyticum TaxID=2906793 RepID=A0ABT1N8M9_9GAMM|nr:hypothetical protein [Photobacterium sp. ZSDE20]MCQ1061090.1 hypothetical protein [Photobacterium sp. ZSDE20]MDD1826191.1 hypothetical protein [Photobacterium sp. ZSDE20]
MILQQKWIALQGNDQLIIENQTDNMFWHEQVTDRVGAFRFKETTQVFLSEVLLREIACFCEEKERGWGPSSETIATLNVIDKVIKALSGGAKVMYQATEN